MIASRFIALPLLLLLALATSASRADILTHQSFTFDSISYDVTFSGSPVAFIGAAYDLTADIAVQDLNLTDIFTPRSTTLTVVWGDSTQDSFQTANLIDTHVYSHVYAPFSNPSAFTFATLIEEAQFPASPNFCIGTPPLCHPQHSDTFSVPVTVSLAPIAAIPEPETYAMMLAGLGLLAGVARRRKSAA